MLHSLELSAVGKGDVLERETAHGFSWSTAIS